MPGRSTARTRAAQDRLKSTGPALPRERGHAKKPAWPPRATTPWPALPRPIAEPSAEHGTPALTLSRQGQITTYCPCRRPRGPRRCQDDLDDRPCPKNGQRPRSRGLYPRTASSSDGILLREQAGLNSRAPGSKLRHPIRLTPFPRTSSKTLADSPPDPRRTLRFSHWTSSPSAADRIERHGPAQLLGHAAARSSPAASVSMAPHRRQFPDAVIAGPTRQYPGISTAGPAGGLAGGIRGGHGSRPDTARTQVVHIHRFRGADGGPSHGLHMIFTLSASAGSEVVR